MPVLKKVLRSVLRKPLSTLSEAVPVYAPDLDLKFAEELRLDPRVDFSRGSNATVVDSDGTLKWAGHNLVTYSEDISQWSQTNTTVTTNNVTAPDGTSTADSMTIVNNLSRVEAALSLPADTYTFEVWLKSDDDINQLRLLSQDNSGTNYTTLISITGGAGWVKFTATHTYADTIVKYQIRGSTGSTDALHVWGAHLYKSDKSMQERTDVATGLETYYPTTSAAYYAPRFDHDPATDESLGLLIERSRTNQIRASEDFTAGTWSSSTNASVSANQTTAPDGTTTADKLIEDSGVTSFPIITQSDFVLSTNTEYSLSCFLKNNDARYAHLTVRSFNGSGFYGEFDLQEGLIVSSGKHGNSTFTSAEMESYGNGWYRCIINGKSDTSDVSSDLAVIGITAGTGVASNGYATFSLDGSSIFVWGAQLEEAAFPTSYIPTSGSSVTRSADITEMPTSTFDYSQTEGSIFCEARSFHDSVNTYIFYRLSDNTNSNSITFQNKTNDTTKLRFIVKESATNQVQTNTPVSILQDLKSVFAYKENDFFVAVNGVTQTDTSGNVPQGITELAIGKNQASLFVLNGHIKQITYFARRLDDATLKALSQPSLEPSLNLVFDSSETSYVNTGLTR